MGKKKGKSQPIGTKNDAVSPAVAVVLLHFFKQKLNFSTLKTIHALDSRDFNALVHDFHKFKKCKQVAEMKDPSQLKGQQQPVKKPAPTPAKAEGSTTIVFVQISHQNLDF